MLVPLLEFDMSLAMAETAFVAFWQQPVDVDAVLQQLEEARQQAF